MNQTFSVNIGENENCFLVDVELLKTEIGWHSDTFLFNLLFQGSFYVYRAEEAGAEHKISQGIPRNRPIKVLVRIYIVKVSIFGNFHASLNLC